MFVLTAVEEEIRVQPADLNKRPIDAVTEMIEERFFDKVIPNVGLVVSLYDVQSIEGGFIYPNDGAAFFNVKFRIVVFRPFAGEVIVGKLKSCTKEGLHISLTFFEDIFVPEHALQDPSFYNESEKAWVWKWDGNDMFMDVGEEVRLKVHSVRFNPPPNPHDLANAVGDDKLLGTAAKPYVPMQVIGGVNEDGLGMLAWWGGGGGEEPGQEDMVE
ncbi:DNA-directed RNA polymerase II, 19 kDa polypeptide, partial [Haematococcus lacustris]